MKIKSVALCASIAMLSACGGGGGSPTPTATSAPAPTPAPTPTPTPPPTTFNELTGDQVFNTACVSPRLPSSQFNFPEFSRGLTFSFEEVTDSWTIQGTEVQANSNESFDITFGPDDITDEEEGLFVVYRKDSPQSTEIPPIQDVFAFGAPQFESGSGGDNSIADFVRLANLVAIPQGRSSPLFFNCVFGIATELDDTLPSSVITFSTRVANNGTAQLQTGPSSFRFYDLDDSILTFNADPSTGEFSYEIELQGREIIPNPDGDGTILADAITPLSSFNGSGTVSADTQGFTGPNLNESSAQIGEFVGWFFGPQGAEIGLAVNGGTQLDDGSVLSFRITFGGPQDPS